MLKKLFITAAGAAVVSVPLAGAAWATPANNEPPGQRDTTSGQPGIPGVVGQVGDSVNVNPHPGEALPPGQALSSTNDNSVTIYDGNGTPVAEVPVAGGNAPARYGDFLRQAGYPVAPGEKVPYGQGVKAATPGCASGTTVAGLKQCS